MIRKSTFMLYFTGIMILHFLCCCPWSRGLRSRKIYACVTVTPVPVQVPLRWEDNIRMDLEEIGINIRELVDSAQDRDYWRALVNAALNLRVP